MQLGVFTPKVTPLMAAFDMKFWLNANGSSRDSFSLHRIAHQTLGRIHKVDVSRLPNHLSVGLFVLSQGKLNSETVALKVKKFNYQSDALSHALLLVPEKEVTKCRDFGEL